MPVASSYSADVALLLMLSSTAAEERVTPLPPCCPAYSDALLDESEQVVSRDFKRLGGRERAEIVHHRARPLALRLREHRQLIVRAARLVRRDEQRALVAPRRQSPLGVMGTEELERWRGGWCRSRRRA